MAEKWLVIDDSTTIQRVIKLAFQDYDVLITEADSCQEALRELARSTPGLVIADAALAGVQSVQDFAALKQRAPQSAFIIIEGSYDHIDEAQFKAAGFRHFLKKPFDAAQLLEVTRQALGRAIPPRFQEGAVDLGASFTSGLGEILPPPPPARGFEKTISAEAAAFDLGLDSVLKGVGMSEPVTANRFAGGEASYGFNKGAGLSFSLDEEPEERKRANASPNPSLSGMLEPMLQQEMEKLVRATVEEYCQRHFAELAREVIVRELERLSQERARLLVDK